MENPCWVDWIKDDYLQFFSFWVIWFWLLISDEFHFYYAFHKFMKWDFNSISHRIVSTSQLALVFSPSGLQAWQRYGNWIWLLLIFCYMFSFLFFFNSGVRIILLFVFFIDVSSPFVFWGVKASRESATLNGFARYEVSVDDSTKQFIGNFPGLCRFSCH